jgi:hypothetical protein
MRTWADRGRTLPGRHDPEWARLAAPPADTGPYGALREISGTAREPSTAVHGSGPARQPDAGTGAPRP